MGGAYDERLLGGGPGEETSLPRRDQVRIFIGRVESFSGIGLEVKELCTGEVEFRDSRLDRYEVHAIR